MIWRWLSPLAPNGDFSAPLLQKLRGLIETPVDLKPILKDLYCKTKLCRSFTREVISYINFSRDPCNEFYEYVCEGYLQEALNDRFKWTEPGLDYARLSSVLDGIYRRNVSNGPVWERKFASDNLWELASPLYERCLQGDAAAVDLPKDLDDYFQDGNTNLSEILVEAYKLIPLVDLVVTTACLGSGLSWTPRTWGAPSSLPYMSKLIRDIWNGVTPNNSIRKVDADDVAYIEATIAKDEVESEIAAYLRNYGRYTDQGNVRVMFPAGLTALQHITARSGAGQGRIERNKRRIEWLHVAARLALASGSEPAASAAVTLMTGVLGKAHNERRCMTLFDTEVRPFAFDRVRAMVHTDETAARVKKLDAQFREYARKLADNATFGGAALQERIEIRPMTVPKSASFWEHLRLVKEAIFDVGMSDSFDNTNLSWVHFSPLAHEPYFAWDVGAIYIPPLFYERIRTMTDVKDDEGIPLDLPLFWWAVLRQFATILSQRGCLYEKNAKHRHTLGFDTDKVWSIGRPCIDFVLSNIGASVGAEEYDYLHAEPYLLMFLHHLYMTKAESWKAKAKPDAEKILLHDHPDLTLDKLFAIAFGSNFCRKEDADIRTFRSEKPPNLNRKQWLMYLIQTWVKFRDIFNCTGTDKYVIDHFTPCHNY
ncbi:hypothetical protein MTO96_007285 [Rhipicephalus appendiculatus]